MKYSAGNPDALKEKFWLALADSPFLFLELDGQSDTSVPMTAQLDKDRKQRNLVLHQQGQQLRQAG